MTKYVDGFVLVVPKKNFAAYRKMAQEGARIWRYGYGLCHGHRDPDRKTISGSSETWRFRYEDVELDKNTF